MFETPNSSKKMLVCFSDTEDDEDSDMDLTSSSSTTTTPMSERKMNSSLHTPLQSLMNHFNQMSLTGSSTHSTPKKMIQDFSLSSQINFFGNSMIEQKENIFATPTMQQSPVIFQSPHSGSNSKQHQRSSNIKNPSASVEKQMKKKHAHSQENNSNNITLTPMTKSRLLDKLRTQEQEFQKMQELSALDDNIIVESSYDEKVKEREKQVSEINEKIINKIRETEVSNHDRFLKIQKSKISAALEGTSKQKYQEHLALYTTLLEHRINCQVLTTINLQDVEALKKNLYSTLLQLSPYKEDLTTTALQIISLLLQFSSRNDERWVDMAIDILCDQIILISSSWCSVNQSYAFGFAYFCSIVALFFGKKFLPCLMFKFNRICSYTIPLYYTFDSAKRMLNLDHPELEKSDPELFRHLQYELLGFTHEFEPEGSRIKRRNGIVLTFGALFGNASSSKYYEIVSFVQSLIMQNDETLRDFPFVLDKFYSFKQADFEENLKLFGQYFGIDKGFGWLSTIVNQPPRDCSCGIIDFFLRGCGYSLWQEMPEQFEKLMKHLLNSYLSIVPDSTPLQIVQRVKKFAQLCLNRSLQPQKASFLPLISEMYQQQMAVEQVAQFPQQMVAQVQHSAFTVVQPQEFTQIPAQFSTQPLQNYNVPPMMNPPQQRQNFPIHQANNQRMNMGMNTMNMNSNHYNNSSRGYGNG